MSLSIIEKAIKVIKPLVESEGYSLYDVAWVIEQGQNILRVMIEKGSLGVMMEDCVKVSHLVEDILEVKDVVSAKYNLEVSSPGLNRPLRLKEHFDRVVGQSIQVKTKGPLDGRKNFKGQLLKLDEGTLSILIDGREYIVPLQEIAKANLEVKL